MQVVLWGVLGVTLGLAYLETEHRRRVGTVDLRPPQMVDVRDAGGGVRVGVRLPVGWAVDRDAAAHTDGKQGDGGDDADDDAADPAVLFIARETTGGGAGRRLVVRCQRVARPVSAGAFLGELLGTAVGIGDPPAEDPSEGGVATAVVTGGRLPVAGAPGVWRLVVRTGAGAAPVPAYVAAGVVPPGWGVSVVLECPGGPVDPEGDRDVLRRVAAGIAVGPGR